MKLYQAILISAQLGSVLSAALDASASKCGSLGPLNIDKVPDNVNITNLRSCEAHPLELKAAVSNTTGAVDTNLRLGAAQQSSCYTKAPYGE